MDDRGDDPTRTSTVYWQSQLEKSRVYDFFFDPKMSAAYDLLETLFMRLSFHLWNEKLSKILTESDIDFGPFSPNDGEAYDLSYHSLALYLGDLGDDKERQIESEWCQYAMGVADEEYLKEVVNLGYGNGQLVDAKVFREEIMLYITKLRNGMSRYNIAHVFSTSVKHVWMKTDKFVKARNRCLLDQPALALSDGYKKELIAVLDDLTNNMPKRLHALGNIVPMQAYFLKTVLQKPFVHEVLPTPAELPIAPPPPVFPR